MTSLFGVIGWPIGHSRSPAMHNAALQALGEDAYYLAIALPPVQLGRFVAIAAAAGFRGLNVTIPHKEAVLPLCAPEPLAARAGAVNTLVFEGDRIVGVNTDIPALDTLLEEAAAPRAGRAVILGAGGAARAAVMAVRSRGLEPIVASRRALPLTVDGSAVDSAAWTSLPVLLDDAALLIDATPRGLDDAAETLPLDRLPNGAVVVDLVARRTTPLVDAARARGLVAHTGVAMLLHQGAAAFERWIGRPAPVDIMRQALLDSI